MTVKAAHGPHKQAHDSVNPMCNIQVEGLFSTIYNLINYTLPGSLFDDWSGPSHGAAVKTEKVQMHIATFSPNGCTFRNVRRTEM